MNNWLKDDEINRIPLQAMLILDDLIREGLPVVLFSSEGHKESDKQGFWTIKVDEVPAKFGFHNNQVTLYSDEIEPNYRYVADQIVRYIRHLKTDVYPCYRLR